MSEEKSISKQVLGRPSILDNELLRKIEEASAYGATMNEIAFYAGIYPSTLFRWCKENPALKERIKELQNKPILLARETIVKDLKTNPETAKWYLERKMKQEFSPRQEVLGAVEISQNYEANEKVQKAVADFVKWRKENDK